MDLKENTSYYHQNLIVIVCLTNETITLLIVVLVSVIIEGDTGYKVIPFRDEYKSNTCEYDCCIYFWNFILLQDCFKQNWSEHRKVHKSAKAAGTGVPHYTQTKPGFHINS